MKNYNLEINPEFIEYVNAKHKYFNGVRYEFVFDNGEKVSVVKNSVSYGYFSDTWEVLSPLSKEPIGHLTDKEVNDILAKVIIL